MKQILATIKNLILLTEETTRNRKDIQDLQKQMKEVWSALERLTYEVKRTDDRERNERERLVLQLENQLLKFERSLKPSEE